MLPSLHSIILNWELWPRDQNRNLILIRKEGDLGPDGAQPLCNRSYDERRLQSEPNGGYSWCAQIHHLQRTFPQPGGLRVIGPGRPSG